MMTEVIARTTDPVERHRMVGTLTKSSIFQGMRSAVASLPASMGVRSPGEKYRLVYSAHHKNTLPGRLVRREGGIASRDSAIDEAFDGSGTTFDFYQKVFGRTSLDGNGLILASTAHYGGSYDNAFWDGSKMVYGDGDGQLFKRFTTCLDVIAHELSHGFTQYTSNLDYSGESGALNEHISDAFASMVKQWSAGQTAEGANWLIGDGLFMPGINGTALRSLLNPGSAYDDKLLGKDPQPAHVSQMKLTGDDDGGVHINSGIPNRAFALACRYVGGSSWLKVGKIWYEVAARKLWSNAMFQDMADLTSRTAVEMFGEQSGVDKAVRQAWGDVGITAAPNR